MGELLELITLGGLQIRRGGEPLTGFESRKAQALLVYLAVERRPHSREALAGLLWGESPEARARGNLRRVLTNLRDLVDPHMLTTSQTVAFNAQSDYWLDADDLVKTQTPTPPSHMRDAVALYRGDFLAGFHVRGAPDFEEWALSWRERLRTVALHALHSLVAHHSARGEHAEAIAWVGRLLALDPWREEAHRQLMLLLALTGQRSAALAQYETCRRLLSEGLGLEPLEETTALYGRLVSWETGKLGDWRSGIGEASVPDSQSASLPFVGRGKEHSQLVAWWERSRQGGGKLALVEGEAGVGKTRLVEEVLRYAEAQGTVVLRGRCYEFGTGLPYQPIAEALRSLLNTRYSMPNAQYPLSNLEPVWLAELSRLVPELRQACPSSPEPVQVTGEAARQRLFEAVARFLPAICNLQSANLQPAMCLFFLDDLHWADSSTLDLLHYLVRHLVDTPAWFVGAYRPEEVRLSHPLTRLRQGLSRDHLVDHLILGPLSPAAVAQCACVLVGPETGADLGAFLYRESEGNPFILAETVSDLQERGALQGQENGRWAWAGTTTGAVPVGVRDVILQRVGRLDEPAQRLLTLAAVIGRGFDAALLRAAAGPDVDAVDQSLEAWLTRRLVSPQSRAEPGTEDWRLGTWDFSHDKIRAAVYHAAGAGQRRDLHRQVGMALESLRADQLEEVCEQLAYHYEQAGEGERALTYLPLAAARAVAVYAHQEALTYYDRALALLAGEDERRWAILLERGKILRFLGQYDEALAACRQVFEFGSVVDRLLAARAANELSTIYWACRDFEAAQVWIERAERLTGQSDVGEEPARLREQAQAKRKLGDVELELGNLERAQESFEEALALYRTLPGLESPRGAVEAADQRSVAMCLHGLGSIFRTRGQYDQARHRFEEALAIYRALGDRESEASTLRAIGAIYWRQGDNNAALRALTEGLDISRAIGNRWDEAASLNNLGLVHFVQGARGEARRCWEESVVLYRSLGLDSQTSYGLHNLSILYMGEGDYAAAQQCLEEGWSIARSSGAKAEEPLHLGWLGRLHFLRGAYDEARRRLETTLALDREVGGTEEEVWHLAWLGAVAYEMEDLDEARNRLQAAIQLAGERNTSQGLDEAHRWLAAVYLAQGDGQNALAVAQQALAVAEAGDDPEAIGQCCAVLGLVYGSGLTGDGQDPVPHFERARALLEERDPFMYGAALRCYGAYLLRSGDREQGRAYLHEAQGILGRIGAQGELAKVARLLAGGLPRPR